MNETRKTDVPYIVGWNDILGFKGVLENMRVDYLEHEIVSRLKDVKENLVGRRLIDFARHVDVKETIKSIEMRVISDTLAVICPVKTPAWTTWFAFLSYSAKLHEALFDIGLPLRGAISVGDLCVRDWGLFGAPVVRAHKASEELDLAACVVLPDAVDAMHTAFCAPQVPQRLAMFAEWYDVPVKSLGKSQRMLVQLLSKGFIDGIKGDDIGKYVREKFLSHGKLIDNPSAQQKMNHTVSLLQWNRWLWEHGAPGSMLKTLQDKA